MLSKEGQHSQMQGQDLKNVASVIEENSQWVTLQQLVAQGKSHVRVISRRKTLQLVEAVVEDAIRRGSVEVPEAQRKRIVAEANDQFQRVSRIQAESESLIQKQQELLTRQQTQIQKLEEAQVRLRGQIVQEQGPRSEYEKTTQRQVQAIEEAQRYVRELAGRERKATRALARLNRRMASVREKVVNDDQEIERLAEQVHDDATLIERLRQQLNDRERELDRLKGLMEALEQEVSVARDRRTEESERTNELRNQLAEMKSLLTSLEPRGIGAAEAILDKIAQQQATAQAQMEDRWQTRLNHALDKIDRAVQTATMRAIDHPVEATDVYLSKIFDDEVAMESNLKSLDVQMVTAKQSISDSLQRLKKLRGRAVKAVQDQEQTTGGAHGETSA